MVLNRTAGKIAYGILFIVLLPSFLVLWAYQLDTSSWPLWPVPVPASVGLGLAIAGLALMGVSMHLLWRDGKGLPMNAYPTKQRVTRLTYRWFGHPIYAGFVLLVAGSSAWVGSSSGFWIITPVVILAAIALVVGYEAPATRQRLGEPKETALLGIPLPGAFKPVFAARLGAAIAGLTPWAVLYYLFSKVPASANAVNMRMAWELELPQPDWAVWVYSAVYLPVVLAPFLLPTRTLLRRWMIEAWAGTALGYFCLLSFPNFAEPLTASHAPIAAWLLDLNRQVDAAWLAAPSFHVFWTVVSAAALSKSWCSSRATATAIALTLVVAASCVLTGSHAIADVLAGLALGLFAWKSTSVWQSLVQAIERLGNSWSSFRIGPVRVISHATWSFAGAAAGTALILHLVGAQYLAFAAAVIFFGLLSAGAWGYWLEGGGRLSRPFGYYGYLFGSMLALLALWLWQPARVAPLVAAFAAAAPLAQALGRLRCVVQGCCHGKPVLRAYGMRVTHPMSRVTSLGNLCGIAIHPTPLYSILANLVLAALLLRLWQENAPWTLIAGLYLALSSLARFAEERYRGELQTAVRLGLPVYQWLAIGQFVAGLGLAMMHGTFVESEQQLDAPGFLLAMLAGTGAAFLMSMDFPGSDRRFSRLTVSTGLASNVPSPDAVSANCTQPSQSGGNAVEDKDIDRATGQ